MTLAVIATHPVQYHAPVYRELQTHFDIPTTALYASDFSISGYYDHGFGTQFAWDTDLLSGYNAMFLSKVEDGGARNAEEVSAKGIQKLLRQVNPKAILLTGYRPRFDLRAFVAARQMRMPLLFRAETLDNVQTQSITWKRYSRDLFLRTFYSQMSYLLYIGQRSHHHYLRLGVPESKLIFAPYCVDISSFETGEDSYRKLRILIRERLQISPERFVILVSGKLIPRKAPDFILEGVKRLPNELRSTVTIVYLGDGEMRETLAQQADNTPRVDIRVAGFQNQSKLSGYYHAADLMVLASLLEPWGLVVNEALHHGVPCVVSNNVGSAADLIEPGITGYIFDSGDMEQFVDALHKGYQLTKQADTRSRCRELMYHYSIRAAAQGIATAYHKVK